MTNINCAECGGMGWLWNGCAKVPCACTEKPKPKRSRLRKQSKKKQKEIRESRPLKALAAKHVPLCEVCDKKPWTDQHEIVAGSNRQNAVGNFRLTLFVCRGCHEMVQGTSFEDQLQLLARASRRAVNRALSREAV